MMDPMDPVIAILVAAAVVTSMISAMVGLAGGLLLLGVMSLTLPAPSVVPIHGVVQLFSNSTRTVAFFTRVKWPIFWAFTAPMLAGVAVATQVWSSAAAAYLRPGLGVFILLVLVQQNTQPFLRQPPLWSYAVIGAVAGILAIFVGAIGPVVAPFFLRDDFDKEETIATSAVCQGATHLAKLPAFLVLGFDYPAHWHLLLALGLAVIAGTLAGKAVLRRLSQRVFRLVYKGVLITLALYLVVIGVTPFLD